MYAPDNQEDGRPALVIIHGGGFFGGSNEQGSLVDLSNQYASRGWVVFSINYRLAAQHGTVPTSWLNAISLVPDGQNIDQVLAMYPANRDAKAALRWVVSQADEYGIDENHISVLGGSAGAFISIKLVLQTLMIMLMNCPSGRSNITVYKFIKNFKFRQCWTLGWSSFGGHFNGYGRRCHFDANDAPLMIVHGTADLIVEYLKLPR